MYKYGVTANVIAPVAKSRMSGNVPFGARDGRARGRRADGRVPARPRGPRTSPARCTRPTAAASRCGTSPPRCGRCDKDGRWTPEEIAARFDELGQERMAMLDRLEEMAKAAASGDMPNQ